MLAYTVHRRPAPPSADPDVVLIKEGFCWSAFALPPVWMLWHRQWLAMAVYLLGAAAIAAAATFMDEIGQAILALGYHVLIGFSANDWRRGRLARQGYRLTDIVLAAGLDEAETKLFHDDPRPLETENRANVRPKTRYLAAARRSEPAAPLAPWSP